MRLSLGVCVCLAVILTGSWYALTENRESDPKLGALGEVGESAAGVKPAALDSNSAPWTFAVPRDGAESKQYENLKQPAAESRSKQFARDRLAELLSEVNQQNAGAESSIDRHESMSDLLALANRVSFFDGLSAPVPLEEMDLTISRAGDGDEYLDARALDSALLEELENHAAFNEFAE